MGFSINQLKTSVHQFTANPWKTYALSIGMIGLASLLIYLGQEGNLALTTGMIIGGVGTAALILKIIIDVKKYQAKIRCERVKRDVVADSFEQDTEVHSQIVHLSVKELFPGCTWDTTVEEVLEQAKKNDDEGKPVRLFAQRQGCPLLKTEADVTKALREDKIRYLFTFKKIATFTTLSSIRASGWIPIALNPTKMND